VNIRLFGNAFLLPHANRLWQICFVVVTLLMLCDPDESAAQMRTWKSGTHQVEAELVKVTGAGEEMQAVLKNAEDEELAIPVNILSESDQQFIKAYLKAKDPSPASGGGNSSPTESVAAEKKIAPQPSPVSPLKDKRKIEAKKDDLLITTRPLELPEVNSGVELRNFDPKTAIRIDKKVELDVRGFPNEVPVYVVDVDIEELKKLSEVLRRAAAVLLSNDVPRNQRLVAMELLKKNWPQQRSQALINLVVNQASDKSKFIRMLALDVLAVHDPKESLKYILARIDDKSVDVRARAFKLLGRIRDPRVIPELCSRLDKADRMNVHLALKPFGAFASQWVIPWLESDASKLVTIETCDLLGDLGGEGVLEALEQKRDSSESALIKSQAQYAIDKIKKRNPTPGEQGRGAFSPN